MQSSPDPDLICTMPVRTCGLLVLLSWAFVASVHAADDDRYDAAKLEARSKDYPFDDELRVLAGDLTSTDYRKVLDTMIPTDLEAEWQRVPTADNYLTFLARHGGTEKVFAAPARKA